MDRKRHQLFDCRCVQFSARNPAASTCPVSHHLCQSRGTSWDPRWPGWRPHWITRPSRIIMKRHFIGSGFRASKWGRLHVKQKRLPSLSSGPTKGPRHIDSFSSIRLMFETPGGTVISPRVWNPTLGATSPRTVTTLPRSNLFRRLAQPGRATSSWTNPHKGHTTPLGRPKEIGGRSSGCPTAMCVLTALAVPR